MMLNIAIITVFTDFRSEKQERKEPLVFLYCHVRNKLCGSYATLCSYLFLLLNSDSTT